MSNSNDCVDPNAGLTAAAANTRTQAVRTVFIITLFLNAAVAIAKAGYGYFSHSLSLGTDSLHSMLDASGNVLALLGLHWSAAPADARHPYGRRKMEIIAALGIGVLISIGMFELALAAVASLRGHSAPPEIGPVGFAIVVATMIVNFFVTRYEGRKSHELHSALLHADAEHTRSDLYASTAVLASFAAVRAGFAWADGVATLLLVFLVGHVAWEIFRENVPVLLDAAVLDPSGVVEVARDMPGVRDVHRVRSRGVHHAVELDLHLRVASEMTLREAHALSERLKTELRVKFPELSDVVIHVEPSGPFNEAEGSSKTET
ncbi:MAG: cation diffusion facilitator family transporter [Myxococcales bacterium]|nr:cation diffusion facilitator family transporter [Myxococcales bacterium]